MMIIIEFESYNFGQDSWKLSSTHAAPYHMIHAIAVMMMDQNERHHMAHAYHIAPIWQGVRTERMERQQAMPLHSQYNMP